MTQEQKDALQAVANQFGSFSVTTPGTPETPEVPAIPAVPGIPSETLEFNKQ